MKKSTKNSAIKYRKFLGQLTLAWAFIVPFQLYLNTGVSFSLAIILFLVLSLLLLIYLFKYENYKKVVSTFIERNKFMLSMLILVVLSSLVSLYSFGKSYLDFKEVFRWGLFFSEFSVLWILLKQGIVKVGNLLRAILISTFFMSFLSIYQLFVDSNYELNIVTKSLGRLFNDPELITQKFSGVGKFNWEYGTLVRLHGVFANVSHFALLVSGVAILVRVFKESFVKRFSFGFYFVLLTFLMLVNSFTLVRSTLLALILVAVIDLFLFFFKKRGDLIFFYSLIVGVISSVVIGWFTPNHQIALGLLSRFIDWVTLDGYFLPSLQEYFSQALRNINTRVVGFNDYGGVGGRMYILKETIRSILLPNITNIVNTIFGWGVGSFNKLFASIVTDNYFADFGTADNSYLLWLIELGFAPFIYTALYIKGSWKKFLANFSRLWYVYLFFGFTLLFTSTLPDIRLSMILSIFFVIITFKTYEFKIKD